MPLETCQELVEIIVIVENSLRNLRNARDEQDQHVYSGADDSQES